MQPSLLPSLFFLSLLSLIPTIAPLSSPEPQPSAAAGPSIADLMSEKGCKAFADLLRSSGDAADSFASNVASGITAFCPADPALKPFLPRFKNLTADGKASLLLYHAVPIYYSIQMLKSSNGVVNTLATDGTAKNYNFTVQNDGDDVTLQTKVTEAKITGTLFDEDPVALYSIDEVLEPAELFKPAESPAPAPAPAPAPQEPADSPKAEGKKPASPAASPEEKAADQKAADSSRAPSAGKSAVRGVAAGAALFALVFV